MLAALLLLATTALAQEIVLNDVATGATDVKTMFKNKDYDVFVTSIDWGDLTPTSVSYVTSVNGKEQASGTIELDPTDLPAEVPTGTVSVSSGGTQTVTVEWIFDASAAASSGNSTEASEADGSTSRNYQAFGAGATLVPLIIILLLAVTTQIVELSLTTGIFVGACMVAGNIKDGFKVSHQMLLSL